jgi:hypothetical protein
MCHFADFMANSGDTILNLKKPLLPAPSQQKQLSFQVIEFIPAPINRFSNYPYLHDVSRESSRSKVLPFTVLNEVERRALPMASGGGLYPHQLVRPRPEPDFLPMFQLDLPVNVRIDPAKLVSTRLEAALQGGRPVSGCLVDEIGAGLIERHRVGGGADADVVYDRGIGITVTVAGRRDLGDEIKVEGLLFFPFHRAKGVLAHLFHDERRRLVPLDADRLPLADGDAAAATGARVRVDARRPFDDGDGSVAARLEAESAGSAEFFRNNGSHVGMLGQLPRPARAPHAEVFERAAETGQFMAFKVGNRHECIGFHDLRADGNGAEDLPFDPDVDRSLPPQAVTHDERRTHHGKSEAVFNGIDESGYRFLPFARIEGGGVGQKRSAATALYLFNDSPDENRPDKSVIAPFAEMDLYRNEVVRCNPLPDTAALHEPPYFCEQVFLVTCPHIRKKNRACHCAFLPFG